MVIIETRVSTRQVLELLSDDEYRLLQMFLVSHPDARKIIPGSGGLRKISWAGGGKGKRGGTRIIYYWAVKPEQLLMLFVYPKSERDDLSPGQLRVLREIVEDEYL